MAQATQSSCVDGERDTAYEFDCVSRARAGARARAGRRASEGRGKERGARQRMSERDDDAK
eukprot:989790-Pleurochrysis_carterae.AAC.2